MNTPDEPSNSGEREPEAAPPEKVAIRSAPPTKTPMYQAMHAGRYQRQALIKSIQDSSDSRLLSFICGSATSIDRADTVGFCEILHNVQLNENIDLMLHTAGGEIDAAEKLITMLHRRVGTGRLRVIVPDFAKSAGTLIALGASKIIMSDSSELGPIDPQIEFHDSNGHRVKHSAIAYLDAYRSHSKALRDNPDDPVAATMLDKLDPTMVSKLESACQRARVFAEDQLKYYMFRDKPEGNWSDVAAKLIDTKRWLSHGQMIDSQAAQSLGLEIEYLDPNTNQWREYWQLYCQQRLAIRDQEKLFESDYASLPIDASRE